MRIPSAYLSGAIEHAADGGTGWRAALARFLRDELGHGVYDPAADARKNLTDEELANFRRWKMEAPDRFRETVRKIIAWDLGLVEESADYLVALWDEAAAKGGGTATEITLAYRLGKPVFVVLGMPRPEASGWILAAADEVFEDFRALQASLKARFR
jgi:nucleoside 2-deoxyribosyltransferase